MVKAMRKLRLNNIKMEPTADVDLGMGLHDGDVENIDMTGDVEMMEVVGGNDLDMPDLPGSHEDEDGDDDDDDGAERAIDMTDSTAVYGRIRTYLDVEREVADGHAYVNERGLKVETVLTSVETSTIDMTEEKKTSEPDEVVRSDAGRESLTSIVEEAEERMDFEPIHGPEQQQRSTDLVGEEANPPQNKPRRKWTDAETRYVGALLDVGFERAAIKEPF